MDVRSFMMAVADLNTERKYSEISVFILRNFMSFTLYSEHSKIG